MRVLIAGGGVAALETLLALRALLGHRVAVTVMTPSTEFVYTPVTVAEAFGHGEARTYKLADILADQGGEKIGASLAEVDPQRHVVVTGSGERIEFGTLVLAMGSLSREPLPGAITFRGRGDVPALRALLDDLVGGAAASVTFALPREQMWPLPLYELAIMTAAHLREHGASGVQVTIVTPEEAPLELFGPMAAEAIAPLLRARKIALRTSSLPALVEQGAMVLAGGGRIASDRVVTLPLAEGPHVRGVPSDVHGFIPVDAHGRVAGLNEVYAAGDITAFPLKQGGLAAQHADAVAEAIAADAGAAVTPRPFSPVLRGLLLTGGAPLYMRAEPQRLSRHATVAIDEPSRRRSDRGASSVSSQALWWPPAKIAGRYLGPYLATARPLPLTTSPLTDRFAVPGPPLSESEHHDALELALLLADCDARWGDYHSALRGLEAADALGGALPAQYEAKRRRWLAETARTITDRNSVARLEP